MPIQALDGFFRITHARNPGAALGLAQGVPVCVFIALTGVALVMIGSFFRRIEPHDRLSAVSLGLIVSGALGNLIDRIFAPRGDRLRCSSTWGSSSSPTSTSPTARS